MLISLRKKTGGSFAYAFLAFIIIAFGFSGVGSFFGSADSTVVISSGGFSVSRYEYDYRLNFEEEQTQTTVTPDLRQELSDKLRGELELRVLIDSAAKGINLDFGPYLTGYEHSQRTNGLRDMKRDNIGNSAIKSLQSNETVDYLVKRFFDQKRDVSWFSIGTDIITANTTPDEEEVKAYYEAHLSDYEVTDHRSFDILEISSSALMGSTTLDEKDEEDILTLYELRADQYDVPERRELWQFNFNSEEEANNARILLQEGMNVDDLAETLELERNQYALGSLTKREILVPEIADAAFSLDSEGVSDVISNGLSFSIMKIGTITPGIKHFKDEVIERLRSQQLGQKARARVEEVFQTAESLQLSGRSLSEIAEETGLIVRSFENIQADGRSITKGNVYIPGGQQLVDDVFLSDVGLENPPFEWNGNGYIFYNVKDVKDGYQKSYDEVKDSISRVLITEKLSDELEARIEQFTQDLESTTSFDELASSLKRTVNDTKNLARRGSGELSQEIAEKIFAVKPGDTGFAKNPYGNSYIAFRVNRAYVPQDTTAELEQGLDLFKQSLGQLAWRALYFDLTETYPIEVNESEISDIIKTRNEADAVF